MISTSTKTFSSRRDERNRPPRRWARVASDDVSGRNGGAMPRAGGGRMIAPADLARLQPLIAQAGVDGWLLFDFRGRNPVAAAVLGDEIVGSRRVYVLVPRTGPPTALVHAVDAELWRHWPAEWTKRVWVARDELSTALESLVRGKRLAVEDSPNGAIPYLDGVPAGVAELLRGLGGTLVSSIDLVTRFCSVWSPADIASHRR